MNKIIYKDIITFHPGYYIKKLIEETGMTQDELSKRLDTSGKYVSTLINGKIDLTDEMASKLSTVFGTSISLWLNLNKTFIEKKIEISELIRNDEETKLLKNLDYNFWVKLNLIQPVKKEIEKVRELQKYFKISSLSVLKRRDFLVRYRTEISKIKEINVINSNAWAQTAINLGNNIQVEKFNEKKLRNYFSDIKKMTLQSPEVFSPFLKKIFSECGIALVFLPDLKNCEISGIIKWQNKDKVILAINDKRKYSDIFWFSLFQELDNVIKKRIASIIINHKNDEPKILEKESNLFSKNLLIPEEKYNNFISNKRFDEMSIIKFSKDLEIHPGIIITILQKEGFMPYKTNLNSLKQKYVFN